MKLLKKMMIILILGISVIIPKTLLQVRALDEVENYQSQFLDRVENQYEYYNVYTEACDTNSYYSILVVKGIFNNTSSYGVCFYSNDAKKYFLVCDYKDGSYTFNSNERGDSFAISLKANSTYTLHVYDAEGNEQELRTEKKLLKFAITDYDTTSSSVIKGQGAGKAFDQLNTYAMRLPFFKVLVVVSCLVIGICLMFMLILFVMRRGLFNKDKRKQNVLNMKELLNEQSTDHKEPDDFWKDFNNATENKDFNQTKQTTKVYDHPDDDDDELKKTKITNVKEYLSSLGYITSYNILSEEEKNKIMIELMKLKDAGDISMKDYYEETYQLWKK